MMDNQKFQIAVKTALIKKQMTSKALAEEIGISPAYLSDIIRGNRKAEDYRQKIKEILSIK